MFFHVRIFAYSLFFFFLLEFVSSVWVREFLAELSLGETWFAVFVFFLFGIYFYNIAKSVSEKIGMTAMPVVFVVSVFGLLYFLETPTEQHFLTALASLAYYLMHLSMYRLKSYRKDQTARGIIAAASLATVFIFYATAFGLYFNFNISLWFLMIVFMSVTTFINYQYFSIIKQERKLILNYSLVSGFIMAEIVWILNFWPFGYLTTGVISLIFYYVFWDLVQSHLLDKLSKKRIVGNMTFLGLLVILVLTTSKWLPVV